MFLRSNLRMAGIEDTGGFASGTYVAAWRGSDVVAAGAHFWNGNLIVDCPVALAEVGRLALDTSSRDLAGILGPWEQAVAARQILGFERRAAEIESREDLFSLNLARLRVPDLLAKGAVRGRLAREEEIEEPLADWRVAFEVETLGATPSEERRRRAVETLTNGWQTDRVFVLEEEGRLVSTSSFNAALPDCVQVGGVFTPPELRGRGFARSAVAGSLLDARNHGVSRSILFTGAEHESAQACYRALGYEVVGTYGMLLFAPTGRVSASARSIRGIR